MELADTNSNEEPMTNESLIGHILIQMKSEFNKPSLECTETVKEEPTIISAFEKTTLHNLDEKCEPNGILRLETNGVLTEASVEIIDNCPNSRESGFEINLDNIDIVTNENVTSNEGLEALENGSTLDKNEKVVIIQDGANPNEILAAVVENLENEAIISEQVNTLFVAVNQKVEVVNIAEQKLEELDESEEQLENFKLEISNETEASDMSIDAEVDAIEDASQEENNISDKSQVSELEKSSFESDLVDVVGLDDFKDSDSLEKLSPGKKSVVYTDRGRKSARRLRNKTGFTLNSTVKRSSRRLTKEISETVLQSAIARKEKSYNETSRPQRLSKRLRPNDSGSPPEPTVGFKQKEQELDELIDDIKIEPIEPEICNKRTELTNGEVVNDELGCRRKSVSSNGSFELRSSKRRKISNVSEKEIDEGLSMRRRSHRRPGSPHLAEQAEKPFANPPENAVGESFKWENIKQCLCLKRPNVTIQYEQSQEIFCTAVDCMDGKSVGCNNLATCSQVRRPSTRTPFVLLCYSHLQRLMQHNCCPGCGMFCTEGIFVQCAEGHHYHRDCVSIMDYSFVEGSEVKKYIYCLHCSKKTKQKDVKLHIKTLVKPTFLPFQRSYYHAAKMSIQHYKPQSDFQVVEKNGIILEIEPSLDIPKLYPMNGKCKAYFSPDHLYDAAEKGDVEKLVEILASGVDVQQFFETHDGDTALHAACTGGHKLAAYVLLTAGASINAMNARQHTCLMSAVFGGYDDMLEFLVKNGANVSIKGPDGMTALHLAAKIGYTNGCKILTSAPNNTRIFLDERDDGGWTPLVWACEHGHGEVAKYLLSRGSDPQVRDLEQNVPLHWAAFGGNYEIVDLLIKLGVDVNVINVHRESPLHIAARQDRYDCVLLLLAHKARPDVVNSDGDTPLSCCGDKESDTKNIISLNVDLRSVISNTTKRDPILSNDISNGKELNPMQCVNYVDNENKPTDFVYIIENCFTSNITVDRKITTLQSCTCENRCGTESCQCNGISLRCWYDDQERLLPEFDYLNPPMIFECNQACSCNTITCRNRVVQRGLTQRFQIFRTETKGWGVRTLKFIKRGTYVCEYIGEILSDMEADQREDDSYLFDLDSREGETYCIDARKYGNLARFINHHCLPNLIPIRVFIDHHDLHFPRIAFFANRDIAADEELGFDYGEKFWVIKSKLFTCSCGAPNCRYSETTIKSTLKAFHLKEEQLQQQLQQQQIVVN